MRNLDWYVLPPGSGTSSFHVVRNKPDPRFTGDVEFYVAHGAKHARRFKTSQLARDTAEFLNFKDRRAERDHLHTEYPADTRIANNGEGQP